jgi:hypothetical protein
MEDKTMLEVTKIVDDSTGVWAGDLTEYTIHCYELEQFLKAHGKAGADAIAGELEELRRRVYEELEKL